MTAAAPAAASAGRALPPSARRDTAPPAPSATVDGPPAGARPVVGPDGAPHTTGMPSWASEPGPPTPPPHDVTQRVAGIVPAESAWGASTSAVTAPGGPATPARAPQAPARPVRSGPPSVPAPARNAPVPAPAPTARVAPERAAPEPAVEPEPVRNRAEIPVGGRAAARLGRQAAEAAREKSGRRSAPPAKSEGPAQRGPGRDAEPATEPRRTPRRVVQGLVAVVVVAVGVLGFWSFASPGAEETSAQTPVTSSAPASSSAAPPAQESVAPTAEVTPTPVGPVRAPIIVLNSTSITGLAGTIGDQFTAGGWTVDATGPSPVKDVATTTVYFTEGDTVQQQAAAQLIEQFPDLSGPVPRYFELPDQPTPGLVVVATGNWQP
jgi:hypothetical protein